MKINTPTRRTLDRQVYLDLAARARDGLFIHLVLWLIVAWHGRLLATEPVLCGAVAAGFGLVVIARLLFGERIVAGAASDRRLHFSFCGLLLANPFLWGVAGAFAFSLESMEEARTGMTFVLVGVAASGGMSLVIVPLVHRFYAFLVIAPPAALMMVRGDRSSMFFSAMVLLFILYIARASRVVASDYWNAVDARRSLEERARELEVLNITDTLTQVRNRLYFDRQLAAEWHRAERTGSALALLMIDLDHFKQVNDRFGHGFGDACLQATAAALQAALLRPNDLLARYGGEEFIVLLPAIDADGAQVVAERLCDAVTALRLMHDGQPVPISCSVGVHTTAHIRNGSIGRAIEQADRAMYLAKARGRNRVVSTAARIDSFKTA